MTDTTETLLRHSLRAVAEQTEPAADWERLVDNLERRPTPARVPQPSRRGRVLVAAAVLFLVAGGAYAMTQVDDAKQVEVAAGIDYVLPGETVLSRDPLIVAAAPGPEPRFDTSGLGRELTWESGTLVPPQTTAAMGFATGDEASITKAVVLGSVRLQQFTVVITDGPNTSGLLDQPPTANQRNRFVFIGTGTFTGGGDLVPVSSLDMIQMRPSAESEPVSGAATFPSGWVTWDNLPSDTSIVTFADDETRQWIRVRSGVAVFPTEFSRGETFHLVALDAEGNELGRHSETVTFPVDPNPEVVAVGDIFDSISTVDVDGNPVTIEGSGRTVLVYGADWCPPCNEVMADALPALEALGGDIVVYSIAAPEGPDGPAVSWPASEDWPFVRLAPEEGSPLRGVPFYPQTVVLGQDNEVLGSFTGFEAYAERLAEAGAGG